MLSHILFPFRLDETVCFSVLLSPFLLTLKGTPRLLLKCEEMPIRALHSDITGCNLSCTPSIRWSKRFSMIGWSEKAEYHKHSSDCLQMQIYFLASFQTLMYIKLSATKYRRYTPWWAPDFCFFFFNHHCIHRLLSHTCFKRSWQVNPTAQYLCCLLVKIFLCMNNEHISWDHKTAALTKHRTLLKQLRT